MIGILAVRIRRASFRDELEIRETQRGRQTDRQTDRERAADRFFSPPETPLTKRSPTNVLAADSSIKSLRSSST